MRHVAKDWGVAELGELGGKLMVVTGANSGIGFHTALELGARVRRWWRRAAMRSAGQRR